MRQKFYFRFLKRYLAFIKCLKIFDKTVNIRINKAYPVYKDSKIYRVKETKIENTDVLKTEKTSRFL